MQWGQFVAHDVSNLAIDTSGEGNNIIQLFNFIFNIIWLCVSIQWNLQLNCTYTYSHIFMYSRNNLI